MTAWTPNNINQKLSDYCASIIRKNTDYKNSQAHTCELKINRPTCIT